MAEAGGADWADGAGGAQRRINIRTIKPSLIVSIGINKSAPMHVGMLYGTGYDTSGTHEYLMKIIPYRIDSNVEMCVGLAKAFTKRSAENSHMIFAVPGNIHTIGVYGFATVNVHKLGPEQKKYFEIDTFCTKQSFKGAGRLIMDQIKKVAFDARNSITSIVLKSTPGAIPFYLSQGFRAYDISPSKDGLTRMYLNLDESDSDTWKIIPHYSGDPVVQDVEPVESAVLASATKGGARRRRPTKRRSKGFNKKKYTRK